MAVIMSPIRRNPLPGLELQVSFGCYITPFIGPKNDERKTPSRGKKPREGESRESPRRWQSVDSRWWSTRA